MKKLLVFISFLAVSLIQCNAQVTMRDLFSQMPDSLLPYLSHNNKLDLIDFVDSGMESEVTNGFDDRTQLLKLTPDYMQLKASPASLVEMKILPSAALLPDSSEAVVCVVCTFGEKVFASIVRFYTSRWMPLSIASPIKAYENVLVARPDTMSKERYDVLQQSLYPLMISASLSETEPVMTLQVNPRVLSEDDEAKKDIEAIIRQITLNWNGETFKEN